MRLSSRQVEEFFDAGFTLVERAFAPSEVHAMRRAFERLAGRACALDPAAGTGGDRGIEVGDGTRFVVEPGGPRGVRIHRVVWCGAVEPLLARVGDDPRLLGPAAQLLGSREMDQLINQAHFKLPGDGIGFPWHQDSTHRRYGTEWTDVNGRGSYVQTVLALDDVTCENGPLRFLPGSGRLGHRPVETPGELPPELVDVPAVEPTMSAGSVLLFGPYTWHGSLPNRSLRPRRVLINGYAYPGANARVYPGCGLGRRVRLPTAPPWSASG